MSSGVSETSGQQRESAASAQYKLHQALRLISDLERRSEEANEQMESYKTRLADAEQRARTLELQYHCQQVSFESSDLLVSTRVASNADRPRRQSLPHLDEVRRSWPIEQMPDRQHRQNLPRLDYDRRSWPVEQRTDRQRRQSLPPLSETSSSSAATNYQHALPSPAYCKYRLSMDCSREKTAQPLPRLRTESSDVQVARQILGYKKFSHGEFHPATASAKRSLADALRLKGEVDEAERLYHSALKILGVVYGGEGPESDRIRNSLNELHLTKEFRYANAGQCASGPKAGIENQSKKIDVGRKIGIARSALRRKVLMHGENHCATALAKLELADVLRKYSTSTKEAETLYLSVLQVLKQEDFPHHEEAIQAAQTGLLEVVSWCELLM